MEMMWPGAPPVFTRDKSDGVPDLGKKLFADHHVPVCYRAPLRENGRAPIGSLDHMYRRASSECITNRTDVLWKALWMHMLKRFRFHL